MSRLVVASIGPASSVQDGGRHGAQRYGLTVSGAMDRLALAAANTLVGNEPFAAAVEIGPFGATFTAKDGAVRVAHCRRAAQCRHRRAAGGHGYVVTLTDGETLTLGFARGGAFSYLAIEGGIKGEPMFGSLAVNARAGLGSPYPRPLQAGDEFTVDAASGAPELRIELAEAGERSDPRRAGTAGRRVRRRQQGAVPRQRVEDLGDLRPHGLSARRPRRSSICTATTSSPTAPSTAASRCPATARRSC